MNLQADSHIENLLAAVANGHVPSDLEALDLSTTHCTTQLMQTARDLRDKGFENVVTYSRKVFIPLTHLCRDVCHYCTFAQVPRKLQQPYMSLDEVLHIARQGAALGCKEALFTLGEKPELRYRAASHALSELGFESTLHYLAFVAEQVFSQTGLLPHFNPGCLTAKELAWLRGLSPSMGLMLESTSPRLCEKGMPHFGSPDKQPEIRLNTLKQAGNIKVPFTTGILIGIGETRRERIESLLAIRSIQQQYGHIQEVIIQNFRAKPDTKMASAVEPDLDELLWSIAIARIIFGSTMSIQAPPNLSPGVLPQLIDAGINDWGGVSPLTPDFVNPEAPWPHLDNLRLETEKAGKHLAERLTVYPSYIREQHIWLDEKFHTPILRATDSDGFPRVDGWHTGTSVQPPNDEIQRITQTKSKAEITSEVTKVLHKVAEQQDLSTEDIVTLFKARGNDFSQVCATANELRTTLVGDNVTYVVNRNINYTNICYFKCQFCAFSKGKTHETLRDKPYDLTFDEIKRRTKEAWQRGATEVCMQGGIHPDYSGQHYLDLCHAVKQVCPTIHIHAFSPLEIWQGAKTLNLSVKHFLQELVKAGLNTLPGTAAEILDDEVRKKLCANKITTEQWLHTMQTAHELGIKTTATIMFGHLDSYYHWAKHLLHILALQKTTGGFTEFVPLPFVASEAPIYRQGKARNGPTFRECVLMHAVARLVLSPAINNIQASWVKLGLQGVAACLNAGANDLGGTLMNESITKAAGATHGQETLPQSIENLIKSMGRTPIQRTTLYQVASEDSRQRARNALPVSPILNNVRQREKKKMPVM